MNKQRRKLEERKGHGFDLGSLERAGAIGLGGRVAFNESDMEVLSRFKIPAPYAKQLGLEGLNAHTIVYLFHAGFPSTQLGYADDERPKALIIYPTETCNNGSPLGFFSEATFRFLKEIKKEYDAKIRAIARVSELWDNLEQAKQPELLIVGGHGSPASITFSEGKEGHGPGYDRSLDLSHGTRDALEARIRRYFSNLGERATIFLDSCFNGKGGYKQGNIANFIARCAPGRKVIACEYKFSMEGVDVKSFIPFRVQIKDDKHRDGTYIICVEPKANEYYVDCGTERFF